jgi:hypothetical protein
VFGGFVVVGAKKGGEWLRWLLRCEVYWMAGWLAGWDFGGFCNVRWKRSKTIYFDKMPASNSNKKAVYLGQKLKCF